MDNNYYKYEEYLKAVEEDNTKANRQALWDWFNEYGTSYWNGECYGIDKDRDLYPVYRIDRMSAREVLELADGLGERDDVTLDNIYEMDCLWEIVDCEIR